MRQRLIDWVVEHPILILIGGLLVTIFCGFETFNLKFEPDLSKILGDNHPAVIEHAAIAASFPINRPILVVINPEGDERKGDSLRREVAVIAASVEKHLKAKGVFEHGQALSHFSFFGGGKSLCYDPLRMAGSSVGEGHLSAFDGVAQGLIFNVNSEITPERLTNELHGLKDSIESSHPYIRLHAVGPSLIEGSLLGQVKEDLLRTMPLCACLLIIMAWLLLGSFRKSAIVLMGSLLTVLIVLGCMGYFGIPLYVMSSVIPVLILILCITDEVHLINHHGHLEAAGNDTGPAVMRATLNDLWSPIFWTSVTTAMAFLTLLWSDLQVLRNIGLFTAFGVLMNLVFTLFFTPALLLIWKGDRKATAPNNLTLGLPRNRRSTLLVIVSCAVLGGGVGFLQINDNWLRNLDDESLVYQDAKALEGYFYDPYRLLIMLEHDRDWLDKDVYNGLQALDAGLKLANDQKVLSLASWFGVIESSMLPACHDPSYAEHPSYLLEILGTPTAVHLTDQFLSKDGTKTLLHIYFKHSDLRRIEAYLASIAPLNGSLFESFNGKISFGGEAMLSLALVDEIVRQYLFSLFLGLLIIGLLTWGLYRNVWVSLRIVFSIGAANLIVLGVMGWLGLPLGIATSMIPAISIGVGVDYALHLQFHHRYSQRVGRKVLSHGLLVNTTLLGVAFLVFIFASTGALRVIGPLVSLALLANFLLVVWVFPLVSPAKGSE